MRSATPSLNYIVLPKVWIAVKNIALIISLALTTALGAQIKIEIGAVPITLQTLVVLLSGLVFGSRVGTTSQLAYLGAGLFGIPWFSRGGGLNYILSPTFGYLIGFVPAAYVVGKIMELNRGKNLLNAISAILAGEFLIYFLVFYGWQNL